MVIVCINIYTGQQVDKYSQSQCWSYQANIIIMSETSKNNKVAMIIVSTLAHLLH